MALSRGSQPGDQPVSLGAGGASGGSNWPCDCGCATRSREGEAPAEPDRREDELAAAIASLPDELREVVVARTWGGLNFEQIAELAGCSTSTAHRRYEAGLVALRQKGCELPCHTKTNTTA